MRLSRKAMDITESLTLSIDQKAKQMRAEGHDVVGFGAGEPDFNTPTHIIEAAKEAMDKGLTKYTPASGTLELKKAIVEKLKRDNNLNYSTNEIIISNGAKHTLFNIFQVIIDPGDEVIILKPYWLTYPEIVKMANGTPVFVDTDYSNDFEIDIKAVEEAITSKTKAIIINSPNNPTGTVYSKNTLLELANLAVSRGLYIISDEIYEKLIYDKQEHISVAALSEQIKDHTITVNGVSKAYSMTGWRIGYASGPRELIKAMANIQSHATSNPNSIAQYASVAALNSESDFTATMNKELNRRRVYMVDKINSIKGLSCTNPSGAFYVMMNISNIIGKKYKQKSLDSALTFAEELLKAKMVTVVPGEAFGMEAYVRLSYAVALENIKKGLSRIEEFVYELD